eukprot:5971503-Pyramimonas_sp.AAC.1
MGAFHIRRVGFRAISLAMSVNCALKTTRFVGTRQHFIRVQSSWRPVYRKNVDSLHLRVLGLASYQGVPTHPMMKMVACCRTNTTLCSFHGENHVSDVTERLFWRLLEVLTKLRGRLKCLVDKWRPSIKPKFATDLHHAR